MTRKVRRAWPFALAIALAAGFRLTSPAPAPAPASAPAPAPALSIPRAAGSITIDGDTDDPGWGGPPAPARTGPFLLPNGTAARPFTEARAVWAGDYLYLALYAADADIRARTGLDADGNAADGDFFRVTLLRGEAHYVIDVSPAGITDESMRAASNTAPRPWASGAHVASEHDGTVDDPRDTDEEWMVEIALPFAAWGMRAAAGERFGLAVERCDRPTDASAGCARWGDDRDAAALVVLR